MSAVRFLYALYLRLTGLGLLLLAAGGYVLSSGASGGAGSTPLWMFAAAAGMGLFLLIPWWLPAGLRRPSRGLHFVWVAPHLLVGYLSAVMTAIVLASADTTGTFQANTPPRLVNLLSSTVIPALLMLVMILPSLGAAKPAKAMPKVAPARGPQVEKKLPALGAAMKMYIVADWLVLRLMGLGLLGTAYMMWTMIGSDRIDQAALMAYGRDPVLAMYVYAGVGIVLALPFLLPGRIARPRHVGYGLMKALLLVGSAFVLIIPIDVAIVEFTPDMYHPTLIATVPKLVKAISGVSVTSVLVIAFFRQLNQLPDVDYRGDPKVHMSAQDLNALRKARMGSEVPH